MLLNAKELSPDQKLAIEALLGRSVSEHEMVSIRAFDSRPAPDQRRQEIGEALRQIFAEVDAKRQPVSSQEADDIVNEAMRSSRPRYRPHR
jgi:hypothetical protein